MTHKDLIKQKLQDKEAAIQRLEQELTTNPSDSRVNTILDNLTVLRTEVRSIRSVIMRYYS